VRDDQRLVVWRGLLEYNPGAANGSSLGLDPATGEVMLVCRRSLAQLDHIAFERVLEDFIATADLWVREIAAGAAVGGRARPGFPDAGPQGLTTRD
jgi:Tir chaperone protein (CesT) family